MKLSLKKIVFLLMDRTNGYADDQKIYHLYQKEVNFQTVENYKSQWRKQFQKSKFL